MGFFKLPKRCPYCAHKLNKQNQCKNPNCIIGYVPDRPRKMAAYDGAYDGNVEAEGESIIASENQNKVQE